MSLQTTASKEIGGRTFTVSRLPLGKAREAFGKLQRMLAAWDQDALEGCSPFLVMCLAGNVDDKDLAYFAGLFGPHTRVEMSPEETKILKDNAAQETVFGMTGDFADQFEWLDFCIELNFKSSIEKLAGVARKLNARAEAETEKKSSE